MISVRGYFVTFILVIGPGLAAPRFTSEDKNKFFTSILNAHNFFRKVHGANALRLDENLFHEAQRRVNSFADEASASSTADSYGVNNRMAEFEDDVELSDCLAVEVVLGWYVKLRGYNFAVEPSSHVADAFTQVVWKNTTSLGVGMKIRGNKLYVFVVYSPAGNKTNEYLANVERDRDHNDIDLNPTDLHILGCLTTLTLMA